MVRSEEEVVSREEVNSIANGCCIPNVQLFFLSKVPSNLNRITNQSNYKDVTRCIDDSLTKQYIPKRPLIVRQHQTDSHFSPANAVANGHDI
jgi:hypothetical protein